MRSHSWRIASHRETISIHAHDNAAHTDRLSQTRIEVHAERRRQAQTRRHGLAPQTSIRSARFSRVSGAVVDRFVYSSQIRRSGAGFAVLSSSGARFSDEWAAFE